MSEKNRFGLSKKTIIITVSVVVIVIGLATTGILVIQHNSNQNSKQAITADANTPPFGIVSPNGKPANELKGSAPEAKSPIYIFTDKIGNTAINVSEQPLPDSFKNDINNKVTEAAKNFNATTPLDAGDTKAYLGTNAKGPQSVLFAKNGLLILIKSQQKIADKDWIEYIKSLSPSLAITNY